MTAMLNPPVLTYHDARFGPLVEVEATGPGPVAPKLIAEAAGQVFRLSEAQAVESEAAGKVRIVGELTRAGRDYRAAFALHGLAAGGYQSYSSALLQDGPTEPDGDVGPMIPARVIDGHSFVVAGVLRRCGEFVRRTEPGANGRDIYKPGEPFEVAEGLLAVPFYNRWVELMGEPTPRFKRFVDAYAEYRHRCERTANPGRCPEY